MAAKQILVINPNSNEAVTAGISDALEGLRFADGPEIVCETLEEGPFGVESQRDVDAVALPLRQRVLARGEADAYVLACYSDPGLQICREATAKPVFGIQESAVLAALSRADNFGVIALSHGSIKRHLRYLRQMGMAERLAGERALNLSVAESGGDDTLPRLAEIGGQLRDRDGAEVIILGCTGMAPHRAPLEETLGIPVIDPTQAAVTMAIGSVASH